MSLPSDSMFHSNHRALQDRFDGRRLADALERTVRRTAFDAEDIAFIEQSEFFFLATAHGDSVDCSFKGGLPGFVRITGPSRLEWADFDGNSMYRSLGNIRGSSQVGLLFLRFGSQPKRLRVNGTASLAERSTPTGPRLTVTLEAREIFPNCPRYIPDLAGGTPSAYFPDATGIGIKPGWKNAPNFRDHLPSDDPHRI